MSTPTMGVASAPTGSPRPAADPLRPTRLGEFAGQPDLTRDLGELLLAASQRGDMADHILLAGPPGLGKTTLANIVAAELGVTLVATSAPALTKPGDVAALLSGLTGPSVVFVDEIHRLDRKAEELLHPALEDGVVEVLFGEGPRARAVRLPLPPFTLVGATTQIGLLSGPFRDRFGFHGRLRPYDLDDLAAIVCRSADLLGLTITGEAAAVIAARSRGTPRIANRLLRRVRDWTQLRRVDISEQAARDALDAMGVDALGLDSLGREVLAALCAQFGGGPVGVNTLAAAVGEAATTLEEVYEPFLMRQGLLARTPRGRVATAAAYTHLGLDVPGHVLGAEVTGPGQPAGAAGDGQEPLPLEAAG